jgi:hypothetical protein
VTMVVKELVDRLCFKLGYFMMRIPSIRCILYTMYTMYIIIFLWLIWLGIGQVEDETIIKNPGQAKHHSETTSFDIAGIFTLKMQGPRRQPLKSSRE